MELILLINLLLLSMALNVYLLWFRAKKTERSVSVEATEILNDLTARRRSIVEIRRIAPDEIFLRSFKH